MLLLYFLRVPGGWYAQWIKIASPTLSMRVSKTLGVQPINGVTKNVQCVTGNGIV